MSRAAVAWLALVVPLWLLLVLCTYWEPIARDGWGHYFWHREHDVTAEQLWAFARSNYLHNNPRLGQLYALIAYAPGPWHSLITPLLELSLFYLLATLMLGRWPSMRRAGDALLIATIVAMVFVTAPSIGPMLFYRPFTGNYVFGLVLNLLWLVPYRLHAEHPPRARWWLILPMLVLGLVSGMCNEHTGPALLAAGVLAVVVYWRRGERVVPWAWAGIAGMLAGTITLLTAPGQEFRYSGLATNQTTLELIADRGVLGNAVVLFLLALFLLPLVLWIVPGVIARRRHVASTRTPSQIAAERAALGTAVLVVLTLLASPKQGDRLYFAPACLICAAAASWFCGTLDRGLRRYAIGIAAGAFAFVAVLLLVATHTIRVEFDGRWQALHTATPGTTLRLPPYSQERSRYVLGDDFVLAGTRIKVAERFKLSAIELVQREATPPPPTEP